MTDVDLPRTCPLTLQNNQFDFVWPIKFLRIFGYIFYQVRPSRSRESLAACATPVVCSANGYT